MLSNMCALLNDIIQYIAELAAVPDRPPCSSVKLYGAY